MAGLIIALVIVLGGGATIAAADNARPGDKLYSLDLAVEKAKISLAGSEEKKDELKAKFDDERKMELEVETKGSANARDTDLSSVSVTEIEVDVFKDETVVKIEAGNKHYGFVTTQNTRAEVVAEIASKYNLDEDKVDAMIDFEVEDRFSRSDDKGFLNSSNSVDVKVNGDSNGGSSNLNLNVGAGLNLGGDDKGEDDHDNSGKGNSEDDGRE